LVISRLQAKDRLPRRRGPKIISQQPRTRTTSTRTKPWPAWTSAIIFPSFRH